MRHRTKRGVKGPPGLPLASLHLPTAAAQAFRPEKDLMPNQSADGKILTENDLRQMERDYLAAALARTQWRIYGPVAAAAVLGTKPQTLMSRTKTLGRRKD